MDVQGNYSAKSDRRGLAALLTDWAMLGSIIALGICIHAWWFYPVCFVLITLKQFSVFEGLLHNACHYTLFRTRWMNDAAAPLVAWPAFYTVHGYRREHLLHHRTVGTKEDYTVDLYFHQYGIPDQEEKLPGQTVFRIWFLLPLQLIPVHAFLKDKVSDFLRHREYYFMLGMWIVLIGSSIFFGFWDLLLLYWVLPLIFGFSLLFYWSEIEDHFRVKCGHTRSNLSWFRNFYSHNEGYHALHHRYPNIPWYRLPKAYEALKPTLQGDEVRGFLAAYRAIRG
jgi:fatty acid desaturase